MDFGELINSVLGADWFKTALQTASVVVSTIVAIVCSKIRTKNSFVADKIEKAFADNKNIITDLANNNYKLNESNDVLKAQCKNMEVSLVSLCNIMVTTFINSKAVSADTKIKIAAMLNELKNLGVNVDKQLEAVEEKKAQDAKDAEEVAVELEKVEKKAEETTVKAEDTREESLNIYNQILDEQ